MPLATKAYAVKAAKEKLAPFQIERRDLGPNDVLIKILYCGICHSDIHQARDDWKNSQYPMVPGHEIVGKVEQVGSAVQAFSVGNVVGVGCFVDSCRVCENCKAHEEQFCEKHLALTYNSTEMDEKTPTFGGYSSQIVVDEKYVLQVHPDQELSHVAPLLCAGITTYSPLKRFGAGPGKKVAVMGLGGLGHMAVKIAASMGAEVTVLSTSQSKEQDAYRLGAKHFVVTRDPENCEKLANHFDVILDAVSAPHDINMYLQMLTLSGVLVLIGVPEKSLDLNAFSVIRNRRMIAGSLIGGIKETQEMLDYCAKHNIVSDVEVIPISAVNEAYERIIKGDVRYRFVIDMSTL